MTARTSGRMANQPRRPIYGLPEVPKGTCLPLNSMCTAEEQVSNLS